MSVAQHIGAGIAYEHPGTLHKLTLTYEVADSHIEDPAIPPALIKIGQHVLEGQLHKLKSNGQDP